MPGSARFEALDCGLLVVIGPPAGLATLHQSLLQTDVRFLPPSATWDRDVDEQCKGAIRTGTDR